MSAFRPDLDHLSATAQRLLDELHLPGLALGAVIGGEPAWQDAWGWADIAARRPMAPEARQRIASISKTMVGLCIMALVDEGRLSLDSRIRDLLPEITLHGPADTLTVRHLLTHTGGIGEAPNVDDLGKVFSKLFGESEPGTPLAGLYPDGITIEVAPGTKWAYANHGFTLLGEIVARFEGEPVPQVLRRRIFEPLGMHDTDLDDLKHPLLARGYTQAATAEAKTVISFLGIELDSEEPEDGHNMPGKFVPIWGNGAAGGVQSTVPDMLRYATALLRGSGGIVRQETFAGMTSPVWQPDPRLDAWGLSFAVHDVAGHRMFGHGGAYFGGWNSYIAMFPELDAALAIHLNMWREDFDSVVTPLLRDFLGAPEPAPADGAIDPRILETAPGVYDLPGNHPLTDFRWRFNPGRVCITNEDGGLVIRGQRGPWATGAPLVPDGGVGSDLLLVKGLTGDTRLVALRDDNGDVSGLRFQMLFDLRRNPDIQPWT